MAMPQDLLKLIATVAAQKKNQSGAALADQALASAKRKIQPQALPQGGVDVQNPILGKRDLGADLPPMPLYSGIFESGGEAPRGGGSSGYGPSRSNYNVDKFPLGHRSPGHMADTAFYEEGRAEHEGLLNIPDISEPATTGEYDETMEFAPTNPAQQALAEFRQPEGTVNSDLDAMESLVRRIKTLRSQKTESGGAGLNAVQRRELMELEAQLFGRGAGFGGGRMATGWEAAGNVVPGGGEPE